MECTLPTTTNVISHYDHPLALMRTFRVRDQEEEFYMDGVGNVVLVTDGKRVWRREGRDKDSYSQEDVEELVRGEESGGTDHLLLSLLTHIHDSSKR